MKFTIFTPVYNRKDKIYRVWDSLLNQTYKEFEWIVVDDGSTDNVIELLQEYKKIAKFPIVIIQQENLGKHFAWNKAVEIAHGELFVPADSDDTFEYNTLKFFYDKWTSIPKNERDKLSGINVLCKDPKTLKVIGRLFPSNGFISNNLELYYRFRIDGEKWGCIRTDLLKKIPYPEIVGRKNYIQTYTWFTLAKEYRVICYNAALRNYYKEGDSLTSKKNISIKSSAITYYHYYTWHLNSNYLYIIKHKLIDYYKTAFFTNIYGFIINKNKCSILKDQRILFNRFILFLLFIPSYLFFVFKYKHLTNKTKCVI